MGFSRQQYWRELSFPSPEDLLDPVSPAALHWQADSLPLVPTGKPKKSVVRKSIKLQLRSKKVSAMLGEETSRVWSPPYFLIVWNSPGEHDLGANRVLDPEVQQQELLIILVARDLSGASSGPSLYQIVFSLKLFKRVAHTLYLWFLFSCSFLNHSQSPSLNFSSSRTQVTSQYSNG